MKNKSGIKIIIILVLIVIFTLAYFLIKLFFGEDNKNEYIFLKNYEVNEYIPTYVSDEDMAEIYLNDYIYNLNHNIQKAYNLLNEEYRNKRFGSFSNYISYVNSLNYSNYKLKSYYKKSADGYIIFGVYDTNGNFYAFKTKGVMQYSVYLDDYTVEIW